MSSDQQGILLLCGICCAWPVLFHLAAIRITKWIQAGGLQELRLPWRKEQ